MKARNIPAVSSSLSILKDGGGEKLVMFFDRLCEINTQVRKRSAPEMPKWPEDHYRGSLCKSSTLIGRN